MQNNYYLLPLKRNRETFTFAFSYFIGEKKNGANDVIEAKVVYKVWKHFLSFLEAMTNSKRERKLAWKFYLNYKMGEGLAWRW